MPSSHPKNIASVARTSKAILVVNAKICLFLSSHDETDDAGNIFIALAKQIKYHHCYKVLVKDTMDPKTILDYVQQMLNDRDIVGPSSVPIDLSRYEISSDAGGAEPVRRDGNESSITEQERRDENQIGSKRTTSLDIVITENIMIHQIVVPLSPLLGNEEVTLHESSSHERQPQNITEENQTTAITKRIHQISDYI